MAQEGDEGPKRKDSKYLEEKLSPSSNMTEVDVEPDVFYDFFLSVPIIKTKNKYNALKDDYFQDLEQVMKDDQHKKEFIEFWRGRFQRDLDAELAPLSENERQVRRQEKKDKDELWWQDDKEMEGWAMWCPKSYEEYKRRMGEIETLKDPKEKTVAQRKAKGLLGSATYDLTTYLRDQVTVWSVFDSYVFKNIVLILSNLIVLFMIYVLMLTIPSRGLPGRQQIDGETFTVILKANRDLTAKQRFDGDATDVCQGLGWWMHDDEFFSRSSYDMPKGNALRDLTKQTWDNDLNADYKCPILWEGLENELFPDEGLGEMHETCDNKHPESSEWVWWETPSFFLFQDQHDAEEYHRKGTVLKLKATGEEKEFTVMSGSINEKVQMLQPIDYFDPRGVDMWGPDRTAGSSTKMQTFWEAKDRIFPSEWTVQALFNLPWNGPKGWDQNKVVGGFNEFGRRPSAIVQANGHERYGYFIEEAIWQYLERSCWHDHDPKSFARPGFSKLNKYDKSHENPVKWEDLDQDQRAWWRALGLGVDRSSCQEKNTKATTHTCISGRAGCTRLNYHTAKRWDNDANEEALAKERFEKRDFSVIFLKYECSTLSVENGALVKTDLAVPNVEPLTWDDIDAGQYEDGRFLEAATNLGYDEDEWNDHGINPTRGSGPPDNLVLVVENYLEGEAYYNLFFFTQIICGIIMVAVSLVEIKNIFLWWKLSEGPKTSKKWFFQTNSGVLRMLSGLGAVCQYVVVPVFTIEVSLLLILESANSVDVIKDTLALLFLLDINNHLQFRNSPDSGKWQIKMTQGNAKYLERQKNIFSVTLISIFFIGAIVSSWMVVFTSNWHHSLMFNPMKDEWSENGQSISITIGLHVIIILAFWWSELIMRILIQAAEPKYESWFRRPEFADKFFERLIEAVVPEDEIDDTFFGNALDEDEDTEDQVPTPPPMDTAAPEETGTWKMGVGPYGQPMELLVEWNTGRTLAQRVPGDTSGKSTVWFYPDGRASAPGLMQGGAPPQRAGGVMFSMPPPVAGFMNTSLTYAQQPLPR